MITFVKKTTDAFVRKTTDASFAKKTTDAQPLPEPTEDNRFEQIRKAAAERHRKADTDGTRRRARQKAEDNRLL